jgi:hypothetical protein
MASFEYKRKRRDSGWIESDGKEDRKKKTKNRATQNMERQTNPITTIHKATLQAKRSRLLV